MTPEQLRINITNYARAHGLTWLQADQEYKILHPGEVALAFPSAPNKARATLSNAALLGYNEVVDKHAAARKSFLKTLPGVAQEYGKDVHRDYADVFKIAKAKFPALANEAFAPLPPKPQAATLANDCGDTLADRLPESMKSTYQALGVTDDESELAAALDAAPDALNPDGSLDTGKISSALVDHWQQRDGSSKADATAKVKARHPKLAGGAALGNACTPLSPMLATPSQSSRVKTISDADAETLLLNSGATQPERILAFNANGQKCDLATARVNRVVILATLTGASQAASNTSWQTARAQVLVRYPNLADK